VIFVPPSRNGRDPVEPPRVSDDSWNRWSIRTVVLTALMLGALAGGSAAFGFWWGVAAAACVPVISGIQAGVVRAREEIATTHRDEP
jgi:hypothetical protein